MTILSELCWVCKIIIKKKYRETTAMPYFRRYGDIALLALENKLCKIQTQSVAVLMLCIFSSIKALKNVVIFIFGDTDAFIGNNNARVGVLFPLSDFPSQDNHGS